MPPGKCRGFLFSAHSACLLLSYIFCISLTLFLMTKDICMKTGSLFLGCSSVPAVYFPPGAIILCLWHHNWVQWKLLCHHKRRIVTSGEGMGSGNR